MFSLSIIFSNGSNALAADSVKATPAESGV
jgi:hypothetical protein